MALFQSGFYLCHNKKTILEMETSEKMKLEAALAEYETAVKAWHDAAKKQAAAVAKLEKAVAQGNLRDVEKLRAAAQNAAQNVAEKADDVAPLDFDAAHYLSPDGGFFAELERAAQAAGVRLAERDGVIFCYPVLLRAEAEIGAVRIDKKLEFNLRPGVLAALLKKAQAQEPKSKSAQFIETLFEAYDLLRAGAHAEGYIDRPLGDIYKVLTLLPGAAKDYTLLDFTRDVYFLDTSGIGETKKGYRLSLPSSTASREGVKGKRLHFVTRDGQEKEYSTIKFTPPR